MLKRTISVLLGVGLLATMALALPDFSGDFVRSGARGASTVAKIFFSNNKWRINMTQYGMNTVIIGRKDLGKMWILNPDRRTYSESVLPADDSMSFSDHMTGEISRQSVGREMVNGVLCNKYLSTYRFNGAVKQAYQWVSLDNKVAIKTAANDNSWSVEIKNIVMRAQSASLFTLPAGYSRVTVPSIPAR